MSFVLPDKHKFYKDLERDKEIESNTHIHNIDDFKIKPSTWYMIRVAFLSQTGDSS